MSDDKIGWDNNKQLIANGSVHYGTDMAAFIAYVMSPVDSILNEPAGLKVFIDTLKKIGLESEYANNHHVKLALRNCKHEYQWKIVSDSESKSQQ